MANPRALQRLGKGLFLVGLFLVGGAALASCSADPPVGCDGDDEALLTERCRASLDELCAGHGEEPSCETQDPIPFGDLGTVRCALARGVRFSDVASCEVEEIATRCYAFIDRGAKGSSCEDDQCASEAGRPETYLTALERDRLLIRRPCGSLDETMTGPVIGDAHAEARSCAPDDESPPAICTCAELACAQLR